MISLENVLKTSLQDVLKMSWRGFEDVLKMFWRSFCKMSWRRLENVLKTSWRRMAKTNILVLTKTPSRRRQQMYDQGRYIYLDQDVLKTTWRCLLKTRTKDVFKTSSRRLHQDKCLLGRKHILNIVIQLAEDSQGWSSTFPIMPTNR